MRNKVFVTGAGGFIGANLVRAFLLRGDKVHVLSRPGSSQWRLAEVKSKIKRHNVEINDRSGILKLIKKIKPKQVFHLAQYGGNTNETDAAMIEKVMIAGTGAIFDACAETESVKAVVNAGSFLEYGEKYAPIKENMLLEPSTAYGCAKAWGTLYGQYLVKQKNILITTLRPTFVFGPWQQSGRFMTNTILSCINGQPIKISNPKIVRDFIFVDDVVKAFIAAADKPCPGEAINIGFGRQMTLKNTAEIILKESKTKTGIEYGILGRSYDSAKIVWQADISKAKKLLGWSPTTPQKEAIAKTIKWFNENKNFYKTNN